GPDPNVTFKGYEPFVEKVEHFGSSPSHSLDEDLTELLDVDADGLPDVLTTAPGLFGGKHGVWFNGGAPTARKFQADFMGVLPQTGDGTDANLLSFSNLNVTPMDLDGDGHADLVHMPQVKTYSIFTAQHTQGWNWVGRNVTTADAQSAKIDFTR